MLTLLHIGSIFFELFSKEFRAKKQPGRPLKQDVGLKIRPRWVHVYLFFYYI